MKNVFKFYGVNGAGTAQFDDLRGYIVTEKTKEQVEKELTDDVTEGWHFLVKIPYKQYENELKKLRDQIRRFENGEFIYGGHIIKIQ